MIVITRESAIHEVKPLFKLGKAVATKTAKLATGKTGAVVAVIAAYRKLTEEKRNLKKRLKAAKKSCKTSPDKEMCTRKILSKHYSDLARLELQTARQFRNAARSVSGVKQKYYNVRADRLEKQARAHTLMAKLALDKAVKLSDLHKEAKKHLG